MMDTRLISAADANAWTSALNGVPYSIAHTHAYAECLAGSTGHDVQLFVAESAGGRAICPISERSYLDETDVYTPYGFGGFAGYGDFSKVREAWSDFARTRGYVASYLMQHPVLTPSEISLLWNEGGNGGRNAYIVDLSVAEEERWRRVSRRKRSDLKQWVQMAHPETDQGVLADAFIKLYAPFAERRSMASLYHFSDSTLVTLVSLPGTFLVGVRGGDGNVSCVALMSDTRGCGDYLFMASTPDGDADGSGVLWLGLQELAARGIAACNLGGGIREGDGVAEMKRRLGGRAQAIVVIREIHDDARYHALCTAANCTPDGVGFFPAYHGHLAP
jgi:hypothetical protein